MQLSNKYHLRYFNNNIQTPTGNESVPLGSGMVTALLGNGGMARVYEIWNKELEVYRAVKLLHPNCNLEALQRFQTEIKITAKFHHPNIVEIHGVGEWNGLPYIEMEKAEGYTLEELIRKRGALPPVVGMAIGLMIARALEYAHNHEYILYNKKYHGVIHRDLKPSNIMVSPNGTSKLMDFGIARPADASFHTVDGTILGTLQYLSPEQLEGAALDIRTDLYSLGVCLYEMACGHIAFPESNITRLLADKIKNRYTSLTDFDIEIPEHYISIIHKCMHHDKKLRVQNATVLIELLTSIYSRFTHDTPEQTVTRFMQTDLNARISPLIQDKKGISKVISKPFFITSSIIAMMLVLIFLLFKNTHKDKNELFIAGKKTIPRHLTPVQLPVSDTGSTPVLKKDSTDSRVVATPANKKIDTVVVHTTKTIPKTITTTQPKENESQKTVPETLIEKLSRTYNTNNVLEIIDQEIKAGHYSAAMRLFDEIPSEHLKTTKAQILKLRTLAKIDNRAYMSFLTQCNISEAEILISKARLFCDLHKTADALLVLEKAEKVPAELLSYDQINRELVYLKATCITQLFDKSPDEGHWKASIGAWYLVKKNLRTAPNHPYYMTADKEIARIGEKYRSQPDKKIP